MESNFELIPCAYMLHIGITLAVVPVQILALTEP